MCCHNHFSIGISGEGQGQNYFLVEWLEHRLGGFGEINYIVKKLFDHFFSNFPIKILDMLLHSKALVGENCQELLQSVEQ